jgi:hypothetical protein
VSFPTSEHKAIYDLIDQWGNRLSAQIEQVRSTVVAEGADLKAAVADLVTHIDMEIAQLAEKVNAATELDALKNDVRDSINTLSGAASRLRADDPAPPA